MAVTRRNGKRTADTFVGAVASFIGTPYVWGGASPKGFDCSGLVEYTLTDKIGLRGVPRTSEEQWNWVDRVPAADVQRGDLVFLNFPGETSPGHVMIYAGNNEVIQAPKPGATVQRSYFQPKPAGQSEWGATIVGYGRVPGLDYSSTMTGLPTPGRISYFPRPRPGVTDPPASGGGDGGILGFFESAGNDIGSAAGWAASGAEGVAGTVWNDTVGAVNGVVDFLKAMLWLVNPLTWLRAVEALFGFVLIVAGVLWLIGADKELTSGGGAAGLASLAAEL